MYPLLREIISQTVCVYIRMLGVEIGADWLVAIVRAVRGVGVAIPRHDTGSSVWCKWHIINCEGTCVCRH